jgi:hypothetical protein
MLRRVGVSLHHHRVYRRIEGIMKITKEHYAKLRGAVKPILARIQVPHTERVRWDALFHAGLGEWLNAELYPYLTDAHIDTALKAISAEIVRNRIKFQDLAR